VETGGDWGAKNGCRCNEESLVKDKANHARAICCCLVEGYYEIARESGGGAHLCRIFCFLRGFTF
jgi:hypothetical protein